MAVAEQSTGSRPSQSFFTGRRGRKIREALQAYLFLFPGTLLLVVFSLFPIGYAFYISLHKWRIKKGDFLGFANFLKALGNPLDVVYVVGGVVLLGISWVIWQKITTEDSTTSMLMKALAALCLIIGGLGLILGFPKMLANGDEDLFKSIGITFMYSLGTVPVQIALSFILAFVLFQNIKGQSTWRIIYFLPYVTVTVAAAAVWQSIFNPDKGFLNMLLMSFGIPEGDLPRWLFDATGVNIYIGERLGVAVPEWFGGPSLALVAVIIYNIWTYVGYNAVIYLAGLGNIPHSLYEAAEIDGANRWQVLRKLTIPLVSPTTYFLVMMGVLGTFRAFNHIYVMTRNSGPVGAPRGTTMTASMYIWKNFWNGNRFGYASALAFVLTGVMLSLTWIQSRISEGKVHYG
jgi:multiple sugar transport system permease protein